MSQALTQRARARLAQLDHEVCYADPIPRRPHQRDRQAGGERDQCRLVHEQRRIGCERGRRGEARDCRAGQHRGEGGRRPQCVAALPPLATDGAAVARNSDRHEQAGEDEGAALAAPHRREQRGGIAGGHGRALCPPGPTAIGERQDGMHQRPAMQVRQRGRGGAGEPREPDWGVRAR